MIEDLTLYQLPAISGDEKEVRDYLYRMYTKLKLPVVFDRLGSIFAHKPGNSTSDCRVMISSNLDETGGIISAIRSDGLLSFVVVGSLDKVLFGNQDVIVLDRCHRRIEGSVILDNDEWVIDIGAYNANDVEKIGVTIGDTVMVEHRISYIQPELLRGNSLRNRLGLSLGISLLSNLAKEELPYELFVGGIAHSVTGQRGAITATTTVRPDVAIVIEATQVMPYRPQACYVRVFDKTMLPNRRLQLDLARVAQQEGIELISHVQQQGTDGAFIHKSLVGTPTIVVDIPLKNASPFAQMVQDKDFQVLKKLLLAYLKQLSSEDVTRYRFETVVE